jgi:hypothetical protein
VHATAAQGGRASRAGAEQHDGARRADPGISDYQAGPERALDQVVVEQLVLLRELRIEIRVEHGHPGYPVDRQFVAGGRLANRLGLGASQVQNDRVLSSLTNELIQVTPSSALRSITARTRGAPAAHRENHPYRARPLRMLSASRGMPRLTTNLGATDRPQDG